MINLSVNHVIYGRHPEFQGQECGYDKNKCPKLNPHACNSQKRPFVCQNSSTNKKIMFVSNRWRPF